MRLRYFFLLSFFSSLLLFAEHQYFPKDKKELLELLKNESINLDTIDTSKIVDMSYLFCRAQWSECNDSAKNRKDFEGIGSWNVSNVRSMRGLFVNATLFNQPIENWDVSRVEDMGLMFLGAESFNQPLEKWNVSNVKNMVGMFALTQAFNQPLEKWNVSNVEDLNAMFRDTEAFNQPLSSWILNSKTETEAMFYNAKAFKQDLSSWGEKNPFTPAPSPQSLKQKEQSLFDEAFALIGVNDNKATQLFLQSLNSKEKESQDAKLYLAYLYLNNPNADQKEANRLANEYVDSLLKDCTQDDTSNFCLDYAKPSEFKSVEDIFEVIYFSGGCYAYGMILSHPSVFKYMGMYYGGGRDDFLGSFCGDVPPPYQIISISPILEAKNYSKILEFLEARPYSLRGSMRFGIGAEQRKNELIYSFFPKFDITSSSKWDYSATEDPDYRYFGWIKMIINQYPDLLEAYNKCIKDTQEYYINVLKIEKQTALEYGKRAVELLLLQELHYYTI
ncbi:BspA family leucine-rich repeat surface protein [Helicobacter kayseriensis]|uniref:BspA family leucine-rich repeat surface protein n=1 Tax=Helicobacter kayseriensis TaxID=2905877 RepID=UPI001E52B9C5|nr:BspA family leucine-rich repeat surface protein [Helicobacter kayseriensis]MCE3047798.1 DUF285 domain-containing protein [Helicobacter kayseriensis]MCE3049175.1 DUF285 domain-containing protein [Helicobacter kayseriensis]